MGSVVRALSAAGIVATSLFATTLPAFAAPTLNPPTGVTAAMAPASTTTVRVTWKDVTREIGYTVERSLSATTGFAALSPQAPQNAVSYDDPGRSPGTTYFYRVRAVGQKNATSPYSSVVSVQVPAAGDTSPPAPAPTVPFTNVSCNTVTVNWTASSDPQSGIARYELTRNGGPASVVSAPSSRTDTGLAASTTYTYAVKAVNGAGLSITGTGSVTTPVCPPSADTTPPTPAPTVSFTNVTCNSVSVNWTASGDPESGINHYELIRNGGAPSIVTAPGSRNDTGLAASTTYSYTVKAINGANLSTSGGASVTTPACPPPSGNPGDIVWTKTGGGSGYETSHGVAVDGATNTIIVG
jgi:chitodextrinase